MRRWTRPLQSLPAEPSPGPSSGDPAARVALTVRTSGRGRMGRVYCGQCQRSSRAAPPSSPAPASSDRPRASRRASWPGSSSRDRLPPRYRRGAIRPQPGRVPPWDRPPAPSPLTRRSDRSSLGGGRSTGSSTATSRTGASTARLPANSSTTFSRRSRSSAWASRPTGTSIPRGGDTPRTSATTLSP